MKYLINYKNKKIEMEQLSNDKFKIPDFVRKLDGSFGGCQLKPSREVILVCQKPLSEKTYLDQALNRINEEEQILNEIKEEIKKQKGIEIEWE